MTDENHQHQTPIAVVGVSALFPGSVDATGFWKDILAGRDRITDVPPTHWLIEDFYDPDPSKPDKTYVKRGAFLSDIDFDPMGWGVPPSIVPQTDTTQLLGLIVARQVLDDACRGQFATMDRSRVSCILGVTSGQELMGSMVSRLQRPVWVKALRESGVAESEVQRICDRISSNYTKWEEAAFPGLLGNVVAGRIANRLDLGGTNCVTDAACASTFSALSMAVNELTVGQSELVIAGGCDTMNDIFMYVCFSKTPALSPTGDCRPFSDAADGTMLGEGLGMVALKRLADAERDGDHVYAVLRAVGSSSDGRSKSVYAPVSEGQAKAVRRAYDVAGYGADTVELVEAHGTGTKAGDAAEFEGLRMVFDASGRRDRQWCALGSVKSQIGHTKSAAGAAGLIKAVLALHHKVLPPTIKVTQPNPKLSIEASPFYLNTTPRPWIRDSLHPRRASVSSFGFGGSNFHVAVEEYRGPAALAPRLRAHETELVLLHGADDATVSREARAMADAVDRAAADKRSGMLVYLARTTQTAFDAGAPSRLTVVAADEHDLATKLRAAADALDAHATHMPRGTHAGHGAKSGGVAFLFPGQGSQYVGMGADVAMHLDDARTAWDLAADVFLGATAPHTTVFPPQPFSQDAAEAQQAALTATENAQPALGAASLALLRVLSRLGVTPAAVAGHSFGEVMALHAAGALSAEDMLRVARLRGRMMAEAARNSRGAMTAVAADHARVVEVLASTSLDVTVANHNAPDQVVLSGRVEAIESAEQALRTAGLTVKRLDVATAFHSEVVSSAVTPFHAGLEGITLQTPHVPVYANATAAPYPHAASDIRRALADQLASPVRFVDMVEAMYAAGVRTFVEVGPGAVLTGLVGKVLASKPHTAIPLDRRGAGGVTALHHALGRLAAAGVAMQFDALWERYAPAHDPRTDARPKVTLKLNGANYAKPYPPPGGAAALPPPNPERAPEAPVVHALPVAAPTPVAPAAPETHALEVAPHHHEDAMPMPAVSHESPADAFATVESSAPAVAEMPPTVQHAWIQAYQEAQRQTAEAHAAFQRAMSDSHTAFLRAAETSFMSLGAMLGATSNAALAPAALPAAPVRAAPAPVYTAPTPVRAAPAPVYTAPAPTPAVVAPHPAAPAPAPTQAAPKPASPAAPATPAVDLTATMLAVVSQKTGYPQEMIGMEMELEADLGVDSIKRVEILAAMRERAPGLPEFNPAELAALRTIGQIVDHMKAKLPAGSVAAAPTATPAPAAPATPAAPAVDLTATMLAVVSQKTGYPQEMIGMEMELEADLGVDSIKRVEILAAMRERAPGLPEFNPSELAALRTIGQIVDHMKAKLPASAAAPVAPAPQAAAPATPAAPAVDMMGTMLEIVAQKTGYPREMIGMEMELEADLGIDSIKRVEILAAVRERTPGLPDLNPTTLAALRTVGQIVEYLRSVLPGATPAPAPVAKAAPAPSPAPAPAPAPSQKPVREASGRYVLRAVSRAAVGMVRPGLLGARRIAVTDDATGVAPAVVSLLRARSLHAEVVTSVPADADAVIFLGGLRAVSSVDEAVEVNREAFRAAKAVAGRASAFVTVQDTGGDFGLSGAGTHAWLGGLAGLVKTAAQEWPAAHCRAVDLQRGGRDAHALASALVDELVAGGVELEVGLRADGTRLALESVAEDIRDGAPVLARGDVVVASGGARGVTAATLVALVKATGCRLVLLGRTTLDDEPAAAKGVTGDAALKAALMGDAKQRGVALTPAALGKQVEAIVAGREVRATMEAAKAAGGDARYVAVDVSDAAAVRAALDTVRAEMGPIAAVIHGAGVLADRLIADKTEEQFEKVFRTKVAGLRALLDATQDDALKALCVFSSVAARCGNQGQCDYAMANEVLNKVCDAERARRGGATVVKSLGWGPWEGGMVTPALKARFESLGVPLISLAGGAAMLVRELSRGATGDVELVLGGEPRAEALVSAPGGDDVKRYELCIDATSHGFIASHEVKGVPVVPAVLAIELFARAAQARHPELVVSAVRSLQVLKGIRLPRFHDGVAERFVVESRTVQRNGSTTLAMTLLGADNTRHYSAQVEMGMRLHDAPRTAPSAGALEPWRDVIYDGTVLFHGPLLHAVRSVDGAGSQGIAGTLVGRRELGWTSAPTATDPALLDGALQLAVLWVKRTLSGASLPTSIGAWVPYRDATGPVHATATGRAAGPDRAVFDVTLTDDRGAFGELRDVEVHVLPGTAAR